MATSEPRPKKNCKLKPSQPLPVIQGPSGVTRRFKGNFNGFSIVVDNEDDMKILISMGYFGKATLSRNYPKVHQQDSQIVRHRVFKNRKRRADKTNHAYQKIVVLPDSDSEDNCEYFINLKPEYQIDCSGMKENVHLCLEEAFFLSATLNCLDIYHEGTLLEHEIMWDLFKQNDKYFVQNYLVFYHFRSKNWVVKTGLKFGGDFLLYKQGPPFYHASYVVIIHVVDENLQKIEDMNRRSMQNTCLMGLNRLCETAGKELLICEIVWPNAVKTEEVSFQDLSKFSIKETIMKRWVVSQERVNEK
jgi:tRNA-splicing endonuclease subunit Sen2